MASFSLSVEKLFDGKKVLNKQTILIEDGLIKSIQNSKSNIKHKSGMLVPGFIDIQVNGGGGCLFNQSPDIATLITIAKAHQAYGTTGWLPTLVTDCLKKMQQAADAVSQARSIKNAGILGIHFEGPHLSVEKKGIHSAELIRKLSPAEMQIYTRKDLGQVIVTLAPENVASELISELVGAGVIICLGHSNADFETTQKALNAGATGFTHLFNAMSPFGSREPGMIGAALLDEKSFAGLILDGIHVHPQSARLALKVKSNIILVTDAMPLVGTNETQFEFFGQSIKRDNGKLTDNNGRLAGSVLNMETAVKNAVSMLNIELMAAVNLASKNPAIFLGLDKEYGNIKVGARGSIVLLDDKSSVKESWVDGEPVV
jgi:N-acetylglucosamine-6-phosphate deacetylase